MTGAANVDRVRILGEPFDVRARCAADAREIVTWVEDARALYLFSGARLRWPLTAGQLQAMLAVEGLTASVVVSRAGDVVGHFDLTIDGEVARLGRVIVKPDLRGRGISPRIADLAVARARRLGAEVVRLNVIATNERAIRAYRRAGFTVVVGDADRADVIIMERQTAAAPS